MHIVVACDKFKGSLTATAAAQAIAAGIFSFDSSTKVNLCPMADGGEGTLDALVSASHGAVFEEIVIGPLPEMKVRARWGMLADGKTAIIESAEACGLSLLHTPDYNPRATTTFGVGQLMRAAARAGARHIILGLGGTSTMDLGIGCCQACGFTILLRDGTSPSSTDPLCGRDLDNILMVKTGRGEITRGITITVACDVINPLAGPTGAAYTYGKQKGASHEDLEWFNAQHLRLGHTVSDPTLAEQSGTGSAGGMAFGLLAWFNANLTPGAKLVAEAVKLRNRLAHADLCITGEGRIDATSFNGKVVGEVAAMCRDAGVPCIAIVGQIELNTEYCRHFHQILSLTDKGVASTEAAQQLSHTAQHAVRRFLFGTNH